jgi:hypothetical protein
MKPSHLTTLWTGLALFLVYYAINTIIRTQGGEPVLDAKLILEGRATAALIGLVICSLMLILVAAVAWLYAVRVESAHWHQRLPVVGLKGVDTTDVIAQIYLLTVLVIFELLPIYALGHFWHLVIDTKIVTTGANSIEVGLWDWGVLVTRGVNNPARLCSLATDCGTSASFLPGFEPTALAVATALALAAFGAHIVAVFFTRKPSGPRVRARASTGSQGERPSSR